MRAHPRGPALRAPSEARESLGVIFIRVGSGDPTRMKMAEREGFEPSVRGYRTHTFQACSFNHSDTSPEVPARGRNRTRKVKPDCVASAMRLSAGADAFAGGMLYNATP